MGWQQEPFNLFHHDILKFNFSKWTPGDPQNIPESTKFEKRLTR